MSNRAAVAAARLATQMKRSRGVTVTYTRAATSETVIGWWGNEQEDVVAPGGQVSRVDSTDRDFLFLASDLAMGEPLEGDRINDGSETFELKPVAGNPVWRWSDPARLIRRAHVKQV